jgi:hypothetical protein
LPFDRTVFLHTLLSCSCRVSLSFRFQALLSSGPRAAFNASKSASKLIAMISMSHNFRSDIRGDSYGAYGSHPGGEYPGLENPLEKAPGMGSGPRLLGRSIIEPLVRLSHPAQSSGSIATEYKGSASLISSKSRVKRYGGGVFNHFILTSSIY